MPAYMAYSGGVVPLAADGAGFVPGQSDLVAVKTDETIADTVFIAVAPPGSLEADAVWRCYKWVVTAGIGTLTWADGDTLFDNVATDLTALDYS